MRIQTSQETTEGRRDWGIYTDGFEHFQKFLVGDPLYNLELSMAENSVETYPYYYDYYDSTHYYLKQARSNNIINPLVADDYIAKFEARFQMDPLAQEDGMLPEYVLQKVLI